MALDAITPALRTPPEGLAWFAGHVAITRALIDASRVAVVVAGVSGLVGLHTRGAFAALTVASFYLFGCSELVGAARHNMHLLWFTALLAVSPSGSRWSVDAARGRAPEEPLNATRALWIARALLAVVYFFPGYWKLREAGLHWVFSDNLRSQMYWKWFQNAWMPPLRIDRYPSLVRAGAGSVLLLELGFPFLLLGPRGRTIAAAGGLAFHLFANAFMRLGFSSLWWCYAPLLPVGRLVTWLYDGAPEPAPQGPERRPLSLFLVGALLVGANVVQGFRGAVQAWPFACYPTFQYEARPEMPDLVVTAKLAGGDEQTLYGGTRGLVYRDPRDWGTLWKLLGAYGGPPRADGLRTFFARLVESGQAAPAPSSTRVLRFHRAEFSVVPEARGRGPVLDVVVAEAALSDAAR